MRMKKSLALLCALMIIFTAFTSLADSPDELVNKAYENGRVVTTTFTAAPGLLDVDETMKAPIIDLLSAQIQTIAQKTEDSSSGQLTLSFDDKPAFDVHGILRHDNLYISSSFLGEKMLHFTPTDLGGLSQRIKAAGRPEDTFLTAFEWQIYMTQIAAQATFYSELLSNTDSFGEYVNTMKATYTPQILFPLMEQANETLEVTKGTFESDRHDPAETQVKIALTQDGMAQVYLDTYDQQWAREGAATISNVCYRFLLANHGASMSLDAYIAKDRLDSSQAFQEAMAAYEALQLTYLLDENDDCVSMQALLVPGAGCTSTLEISYLSKTQEDLSIQEEFSILYGSVINDRPITINFSYKTDKAYGTNASAKQQVISLLINDNPDTISLIIKGSTTATYDGTDAFRHAHFDVYTLGADTPAFTIFADTASAKGDPAFLPAAEDAVRPGSMTDDEAITWLMESNFYLQGYRQFYKAVPDSLGY